MPCFLSFFLQFSERKIKSVALFFTLSYSLFCEVITVKNKEKNERKLFKRIVIAFIIVFISVVAGDMTFSKDETSLFSFGFVREAKTENGRELILINSKNKIPDDFSIDLITLSNGEKVDRLMYPYLQKMFDDMRKNGLYPVVVSGYRSEEEQKSIFQNKYTDYIEKGYKKSEAKKLARDWVALPGRSEHQLGLAVDINPDREKSGDEVYLWLKDNAHKYGFIKRYPEDKTEITEISNEPWHYRFVGEDAAEEMYEMNYCLEEYIEYIS